MVARVGSLAISSSSSSGPNLSEPFNAQHFESLPHFPCVSLFHRNGRAGCGTYGRDVATGRVLDWKSVAASNYADGGDARVATAGGERSRRTWP